MEGNLSGSGSYVTVCIHTCITAYKHERGRAVGSMHRTARTGRGGRKRASCNAPGGALVSCQRIVWQLQGHVGPGQACVCVSCCYISVVRRRLGLGGRDWGKDGAEGETAGRGRVRWDKCTSVLDVKKNRYCVGCRSGRSGCDSCSGKNFCRAVRAVLVVALRSS